MTINRVVNGGGAAELRWLARDVEQMRDALVSLRFCRNLTRSKEEDEAENQRRVDQLFEAVDRLLAL